MQNRFCASSSGFIKSPTAPYKKVKIRVIGAHHAVRGFSPSLDERFLGFWFLPDHVAIPSAPDSAMSASLCMSMTSLAVSGAGRGTVRARMGRAAASKGAVASGSAFFPVKQSAKMTMKSSLAGKLPTMARQLPNVHTECLTPNLDVTAVSIRTPRNGVSCDSLRTSPGVGPRLPRPPMGVGKKRRPRIGFFVGNLRAKSYPTP